MSHFRVPVIPTHCPHHGAGTGVRVAENEKVKSEQQLTDDGGTKHTPVGADVLVNKVRRDPLGPRVVRGVAVVVDREGVGAAVHVFAVLGEVVLHLFVATLTLEPTPAVVVTAPEPTL